MEAIRAHQRDPHLDRTRCETVLRKLGMKPGNAQRLLDESTDVQVSRVLEAAKLLRVSPASLFERASPPMGEPCPPPSLEQALEVLGIELAKQMPDDVRRDVADALAKLAERRGQERTQAMVAALLQTTFGKQRAAA